MSDHTVWDLCGRRCPSQDAARRDSQAPPARRLAGGVLRDALCHFGPRRRELLRRPVRLRGLGRRRTNGQSRPGRAAIEDSEDRAFSVVLLGPSVPTASIRGWRRIFGNPHQRRGSTLLSRGIHPSVHLWRAQKRPALARSLIHCAGPACRGCPRLLCRRRKKPAVAQSRVADIVDWMLG